MRFTISSQISHRTYEIYIIKMYLENSHDTREEHFSKAV